MHCSEILAISSSIISMISLSCKINISFLNWFSVKLNKVIKDLSIATEVGDELAFPVTMYGKIVDVRSYRPFDRANKIRSRVGAISGLIIPFGLFKFSFNFPKKVSQSKK